MKTDARLASLLALALMTTSCGNGEVGAAAGVGAVLVAIGIGAAGGGSGGDSPPPVAPPTETGNAGEPPPVAPPPIEPTAGSDQPADPIETTVASAPMGAAGGVLAIDNNGSILVPPGFIGGSATVSVKNAVGETTESLLEGLTDVLDVTRTPNKLTTVTITPNAGDVELSNEPLEVTLAVSSEMEPQAGERLLMVARSLDESEEESVEEAMSFPVTYDPIARTATSLIPSYYFLLYEDGSMELEVSLAIQPTPTISSKAAVSAQCRMDNTTLKMPIRPYVAGSTTTNTPGMYAMAGPYAEPRPQSPKNTRTRNTFVGAMGRGTEPAQDSLEFREGKGHGGLDFTTPIGGVPLMAPSSGRIVMVKQEGVECTSRKTAPRRIRNRTSYAVTMVLDGGLGKMSFRHLKYGSVSSSPVGSRYLSTIPDSDRALAKQKLDGCWKASRNELGIAVAQGEIIGHTGDTGAPGAPHLHIDWSPTGSDEITERRNPICILGNFRWIASRIAYFGSEGFISYGSDYWAEPEVTLIDPTDGVMNTSARPVVKRTATGVNGAYSDYFYQPMYTTGFAESTLLTEQSKNDRFPNINQRGVTLNSWQVAKVSGVSAAIRASGFQAGCLTTIGVTCDSATGATPDYKLTKGLPRILLGDTSDCSGTIVTRVTASTFWDSRRKVGAALPTATITGTWGRRGNACEVSALSISP